MHTHITVGVHYTISIYIILNSCVNARFKFTCICC